VVEPNSVAMGTAPSRSAALARPETQIGSLAVPRLMLEAELALERGQPVDALARLSDLRKEAGLHTAALRLEMRALTAAGRHEDIPPIVDQLVKRKFYDPAQGELLRAAAHAEALGNFTQDPGGLRAYWNRLSDAERLQPRVARAAARGFIAQGGDREAADLLARSVDRVWDSELVALYAECTGADATRQLEAAERWLAGDGGPDNPLSKLAPDVCETCGFFVRLQGNLGILFGVCGNAFSVSDGTVVSVDHGCGAHSNVQPEEQLDELPEPVWDTIEWDAPISLFD